MASSSSSSVHCSPLLVLAALLVTRGFCEEIPSGFFMSSKQQIDSSASLPYSLGGSDLVAIGCGIEGIDSHMDGSEAHFAKLHASRLDTRLVAVEGFDLVCCSAASEAGINMCAAGAADALVDASDAFVFKPVDGFDAVVFAAALIGDAFHANTGVIMLDGTVHGAQAVGSVFEPLAVDSAGVLVDVALVSTNSNMDAPVPLNVCFYFCCMCSGKMPCSEQDLRIAKMRPCYWFWKEHTDGSSVATLNCCLCRSGHANSFVWAARRQLLLLLPPSPTINDDWYARLSPVKHNLHLRLNNLQPSAKSEEAVGGIAGRSISVHR
ncbi:hypothetical protein ACP70R_028384 [Stipagrostis hirtigluma subsp. patula]